jgi:hypothetical protein
MRVESRGDHVDRNSWYDGDRLTILDRRSRSYAVADMPSEIDPMLDEVAKRFSTRIPLGDLLYSNVYKTLITDAGTNVAEFIGEAKVGNVDCHHLGFETDAVCWEIWIEAGPRPVPRRLTVLPKDDSDQPRYSVTLRQWDLEPQFPDHHFVFVAPSDAEKLPMMPDDLDP